MTLGILFLVGAAVLLGLAWRGLRQTAGGAGPGRIVAEVPAGQGAPRLRAEGDGAVLFGPVAAEWAPRRAVAQALGNPDAIPGRLGGAAATGTWRALALIDLTAPEAFGSGDAALDRRLAGSLGGSALLLAREDGGAPPMLLHGVANQVEGSIGGIALDAARFDELVAMVGRPEGVAVEVLRRRIQRAGWGGERAQRKRAG